MSKPSPQPLDVEKAVRERYSEGAKAPQAALCCPTSYDPASLAHIPQEVLDRDYGCGDPTRHLREGETVLDLGSGSGKHCFMAARVVGPKGRVIGVDANDDMLALARRNAPLVAEKLGYANVELRKGRLQDLRLDRAALDGWLREHPVRGEADLAALEAHVASLRRDRPLIEDSSIDVVVSNCVLNLVAPSDKAAMFGEIFRVLRRGGRAVISDIVSDEDVPERLQQDPELWSGCVSGALREDLFLEAFADAGFYGVSIIERQEGPWQTVEGIELRSLTVAAWKGKEGPCLEGRHAIVYRGPFRRVEDDDGHVLLRGQRMAVCRKTFAIFSKAPYRDHVELVPPRVAVPDADMTEFPCSKKPLVRSARETKGGEYMDTAKGADCCAPPDGDGPSCC